MISEKYKGSRIAILGYGIEGKSTFEFLKKNHLDATIFDRRSGEDLIIAHPELGNTTIISGDDFMTKLAGFDVIFRSPGISPLTPEVVASVNGGAILTSQIDEFMEFCPCPVIGVTGTKGKGTTSTLITEILKSAGEDVYLGGNIGNPALSFIEKLDERSVVVLELSSFQLQTLKRSPHIAVLLNTTSEHLDYHIDTKEYRESKVNILRYQDENDFALISADYKVPLEMSSESKARRLYFSKDHVVEGCFVNEGDQIELRYDGISSVLSRASEVQLRGRHNLENITAASLAAAIYGIDSEVISRTIKRFVGLEHRLEYVNEKDGIKYYNDSFSTVPETAIAAIDAFSEPIVLIAGGSSKHSDYSELGKKLATTDLRALVLIGETSSDIRETIVGEVSYQIVGGGKTMEEILKISTGLAKHGDVVLLSPACASKDMFLNYKDRGDQFRAAVRAL